MVTPCREDEAMERARPFRVGFLAVVSATLPLSSGVTANEPPASQARKTVKILATGGTIAGAGAGGGYRAGAVSITDIMKSVPGLDSLANVSAEQVANVGSADVDEAIWRRLVSRVQAAIADPSVDGIVITHGTDTMEETAFFLRLVLPSSKPVVVVGSMRPGATPSADGPQNLLDAVRVASSSDARDRGVLVVMNDTIFDPASVTKVDFRRMNAFAAPIGGPVGDVLAPRPRFYRAAASEDAPFEIGAAPLPKISIAYSYAGFGPHDLRSTAQGAQGLVIAGTGAGGIPTAARPAMRDLMGTGIPVVRTSRQGGGDVWTAAEAGGEPEWTRGTVAGRELSPAKARILLMLALQKPRTYGELQAIFNRYALTAR
jgi:L-asparaginase